MRSALLAVTLLALGLGVAVVILLPGRAAVAGDVENLLAVCSNPDTPAEDALTACRKVAKEGRLDARRRGLVWLNAGIAAHALGRYGEAVEAHSAAIEADASLTAAFENRALAYDKLDRPNDALADYASAISLEPTDPRAYLGRGILMLNRGAPDRALPDFGRALELSPDLVTARYNRGVAFLQLGELARAEEDFSAVIGHDPKDAGAFLNRARVRAELGSDKARGDYDRAIALRPEWATAWYLRGRYLDGIGQVDDANADFLRAYQLGQSDPWLIERLRKLSGG